MIEIIVLILLFRKIGEKALRKGLPKARWQWSVVGLWILFELVGASIGLIISNNLILAMLLGIACAVGGYLLVNYRIDQYPDQKEDWLDRLGKPEDQ